MVSIIRTNGRTAQVFICDICNQRIEDAELGLAVYPIHKNRKDGDVIPVAHVHKGQCFLYAEKVFEDEGAIAGSTELMHHLIYLCLNTGKRMEDLFVLDDELNKSGFYDMP